MKIFEAIGRALVRYFGRPATSVTPQNGPGAFFVFPKQGTTISWSLPGDLTSWTPPPDTGSIAMPPSPVAIKPPTDPQSDGWAWDTWAHEQRAILRDLKGWSPCRFAQRREGKAAFVFGATRGDFGMWRKHMTIHRSTEQGTVVEQAFVTCTTHLRSGWGIGIFEKWETAAVAVDIAQKVFDRWNEMDDRDTPLWPQAEQRVLGAWWELGIVACRNARCVDNNIAYDLYGLSLDSVLDGKPEKFS